VQNQSSSGSGRNTHRAQVWMGHSPDAARASAWKPCDMTTQHTETLIIGAGQAGLSTGYHLQRRDRPVLIVDANERIGDNWRRHYDSLRLYSPARYDGLPGTVFPARDRWSYAVGDGGADCLERYAIDWDVAVRMA